MTPSCRNCHNRDLSARLRLASERDQLTGQLNTRAFDAALTARLEQGRPSGLILAHVDNMKGINDFDGHAVGNDVLREAGEVLARGCEPASRSPASAATGSPRSPASPAATRSARSAGG